MFPFGRGERGWDNNIQTPRTIQLLFCIFSADRICGEHVCAEHVNSSSGKPYRLLRSLIPDPSETGLDEKISEITPLQGPASVQLSHLTQAKALVFSFLAGLANRIVIQLTS